MLQAKAVRFKSRRRFVPRPDATTHRYSRRWIAGIPVVSGIVNAMNRNATFRGGILEDDLWCVSRTPDCPSIPQQAAARPCRAILAMVPTGWPTTGKGPAVRHLRGNRNDPKSGEDLWRCSPQRIAVTTADKETLLRYAKAELGTSRPSQSKEVNILTLAKTGRRGLGHRRARAVVRVDVQAGTAVDVPRRP